MTRYFLHLHNDIDAVDEEGLEFPDDKAALDAALVSARDLASASVKEGHLDLTHFILCVDETGRRVGVVHFADAVAVSGLDERI